MMVQQIRNAIVSTLFLNRSLLLLELPCYLFLYKLSTPTISSSLNQTTHGQWFIQWFPTLGITHFFTDTQNTTERVEEKNKRTNTDLGQLQA